MIKRRWNPPIWLVCILFSCWFLIVPLVLGIYYLIQRKKEDLIQQREAEKELLNRKLILDTLDIELTKRKSKTEQLYRKLLIHKDLLENQEKNLSEHTTILEKHKEHIFAREHFLRDKENELLTRERLIEKQINDLAAQRLSIDQDLNELYIQLSFLKKKEDLLKQLDIAILDRKQRVKDVFKNRHQEIKKLTQQIKLLKNTIKKLDDEAFYESFGLYDNKFNLENSDEYLKYLELVRREQKKLVKDNRAITPYISCLPNGRSSFISSAHNKQNIKFAIRSFNNECENIISKVKFNNVEMAEKNIRTSFYNINKLNRYNSIEITEEYLNLKLEELSLIHEYAEKKQEELDEQRRMNVLIREERKAQKELEEERNKIKKEEQHLLNVLAQMPGQISSKNKIKYEERLSEIREQLEKVDYRVNNTRAGYVYIISNIGSFGEDVYKIGMTRRLEPMDRVRELGGASVPFHFDIHAVIFSSDAPALEATLHRAFHDRRVNKINERKEFFKVSLAEIKKIIHLSHNESVEFKMIAEAKHFRETVMLEKATKTLQIS
jgi:Domain of unknown function (DUF4041)/Meiotically up-regulated gene 113